MEPEFSRQVSKKFSNIKFHKNTSNWVRVVRRGWTDGRREQ